MTMKGFLKIRQLFQKFESILLHILINGTYAILLKFEKMFKLCHSLCAVEKGGDACLTGLELQWDNCPMEKIGKQKKR